MDYHVEIFRRLIDAGASQTEIADELGITRAYISKMLKAPAGSLKRGLLGEQLPDLLRLCRDYEIEPSTAANLLNFIEARRSSE